MSGRKTVAVLRIKKCGDCPFLEVGSLYSLDGFDRGSDWRCVKKNKIISSFIERTSEEPKEIPEWCPLPTEEVEG